jgi:hypothetical protein
MADATPMYYIEKLCLVLCILSVLFAVVVAKRAQTSETSRNLLLVYSALVVLIPKGLENGHTTILLLWLLLTCAGVLVVMVLSAR